jgi:hypothetical protein
MRSRSLSSAAVLHPHCITLCRAENTNTSADRMALIVSAAWLIHNEIIASELAITVKARSIKIKR